MSKPLLTIRPRRMAFSFSNYLKGDHMKLLCMTIWDVWSLYALSSEAFQKVYGEDTQTSEILGIADYAIGTDEKYIYLLILPTDVQWLENDSVSENQYATLCTESQQVLESFLNDNGITLNLDCPDSAVFSSSKSAHAISN